MEKESVKVMRYKRITIIGCLIAFVLLLTAVLTWLLPSGYQTLTYSMNAYVKQTVYGEGREKTANVAANAINSLESAISWRQADSDITKLNLNAGKDFYKMKPQTLALLTLSREVSEKSGGAFDITIAPISHLWNFGEEAVRVPDDRLIQEILPDVNYENILMNGQDDTTALKTKSTMVDLDAISAGAACDEAVRIYKESDVSAAMVAVGDSVGFYGHLPFGKQWRISVKNPFAQNTVADIDVEKGFASTVSIEKNSFEKDGKSYHSILDPRTGYPAENGLASVTVTAESGALSDALAYACFVLGYEKSLPLLQEFHAQALFVTQDKIVYATEGLQNSVKITNQEFKSAF